MPGAQGHITVRRAPRDGNDGLPGADGITPLVNGSPMTMKEDDFTDGASWSRTATVTIYQGGTKLNIKSHNLSTTGLVQGSISNGVLTVVFSPTGIGSSLALTMAKLYAISGMSFTVTFDDLSGTQRTMSVTVAVSLVKDGADGDDGKDAESVNIVLTDAYYDVDSGGNVDAKMAGIVYTNTGGSVSPVKNATLTFGYSNGLAATMQTASDGTFDDEGWFSGDVFTDTATANSSPSIFVRYEKDGVTLAAQTVSLAKEGIDGCIVRVSEWAEGVEYRNDEKLRSGTRYLDIVVVSGSSPNSFTAFKCLLTHVSSARNKPPTSGNSSQWQRFNNLAPVYTPLIMAANAVLRFAQTNQLLVMKKDDANKVAAGMGGGNYPLWVGSETPSEAPFRVSYEGNLHAENAEVSGIIHSSLTYSSVKSIVGLSSYTIDPENEAFNTLFVTPSTESECKVTLPDANTYEGMEINIFQPVISTMGFGSVYIATPNSGQRIYYSSSTALVNGVVVQTVSSILNGDNNLRIIPNVMIRLIAVGGDWYAISGALTGE